MGYLLILAANLIYFTTMKYGLVSDDAAVMKMAPYNLMRERLVNKAIHILVAGYMYYCFPGVWGLSAAVLFSIHPLTVQVSVWKSGRGYGWDGLIFMLSYAFRPFSAPLYFLCSKGYPTIIFTPLLFIPTKLWYIALLTPFLFWRSWGTLKFIRKAKITGDGIFSAPLPKDFTLHKFKWMHLILVVKTFGYYSLACLLPLKNGFLNSFLCTLGTSQKETDKWFSLNRQFWGGLFAMVVCAVLWWFNKTNVIGIGIALFVLSIGSYCNFVMLAQFVAPRYCYVALIGFQIALAGVLSHLGIVGILASFGLGIFYLDRLIKVMQHYRKDSTDQVILDSQVFPENPRLWYYRYERMLHLNNPIMAWAEAAYGLKYLPEDCQLYFGMAVASFELGDTKAASMFLDTAERFMMLTDRKDMQGYIAELRETIKRGRIIVPGRG